MGSGKQCVASTGNREVLRWGVLGTARTARKRTLPAILRAGHRIVAIAGRSKQRLGEFQDEFGIESTYVWDDAERLLENPNINAIYIPLPHALHAPWTIRSLEACKHVCCEKPIALCPRDVKEIASAATSRGLIVEENFSYHLTPAYRYLDRLESRGKIDSVKAIAICHSFPATAEHQFRYDRCLGGGSFLDLGCYGVDFVHRFLNEPIEVVAVDAARPSGDQLSWGSGPEHPVDTECEFVGQTPSGVDIRINTSFVEDRRQSAELTTVSGETITFPQAFLVEGTASQLVFRHLGETSEQVEQFDRFDCHGEMLTYFCNEVHGAVHRDQFWQERWAATAQVLAQVETLILKQVDKK